MTTIQCERSVDRPPGAVSGRIRRSPRKFRRTPSGRRILAIAFTSGGLAMLPWLGVLGFGLPRTAVAPHWNIAWVGLDALEAAGLFATGRLLAHGDHRYAISATLTGTALLVDAWFDLLTAGSRTDLVTAAVLAAFPELPLAGLCFLLAFRAHGRGQVREAP